MPDGTARQAPRGAWAERAIVLWGGLSLFLVGWATVSLTNASETLFLKRVGVDQLPLVFLLNSALLAATTFVVGRRVAGAEHGRALTATLWAAAGFLLPLWLALRADVPGVLAVLVIAAKQIQALALLVFWVAMGGWVDGRQAKRLVPPMMAGGTLGVAFGSFASGAIGTRLGIPFLVLVAAGSLVLAAGATYVLRRFTLTRIEWPRRSRREEEAERPGFVELWADSGLFRLLAAGALLAGLLAPILYFLFSVAADAATRGMHGEQHLLQLYGTFRGWMNVAILALQIGGTSWLFRRIGVPRAALLAPAVYVLGFVGFATVGGLGVAIVAMAAASLQDKALGEPAERTLATLFPETTRPTVAALLDGMLKRGGGVLGNVVVLATIALGLEGALPRLAIPLALLWLAAGVALARVYPALLLEAASQTRFGRGAVPDADLLDARTTRLLEASLLDADPERCAAACDLALEAPHAVATGVTAEALRTAPLGNVPVLLDTLTRLVQSLPLGDDDATATARAILRVVTERDDLSAEAIARLIVLSSSLARPSQPSERRALETLAGGKGQSPAAALAARLALHDDDFDDILASATIDGAPASRHVALDTLRTTLLASDPAEAGTVWTSRLDLLAGLLDDAASRAPAAEALAEIALRHPGAADHATERLLAHQGDGDPGVRAALLRFLGRIGRADQSRWAVSRLSSTHAEEVEGAQECLRALGARGIDVILESFHCDCRHTREALLPVLRDIPVDAKTLQALADEELAGIRRVLDLEYALSGATTSGLLRQRLRERVDEGTRAALSLFATLLRDDRIAELGPLLERVRSGRERAVLLEALEALLPARDASTLLGVLDATTRPTSPTAVDGHAVASREEALRLALRDDDSLTRAFVAATLEPAELERLGGVPEIRPDEPAHLLTPIRPISPCLSSENDQEAPEMLSGVEIVLHLRSLALFERLSTRELTELAGIVRELSHPADTHIVQEGDFDDCMYLIVSGKVQITRGGVKLGDLGPRDFFGEMAILDGETRSATVTSTTKVRLLRIDRPDLLRVMDDRPGIAISICQTLSRRVRELNDTLRDMRRSQATASA